MRGISLELFRSYLTDRKQAVNIDGLYSEFIDINYGIPQGSVLGPTLFLVYLNDLTEIKLQNGKLLSFADDTVLIFNATTWSEVQKYSEIGLKYVSNWLSKNILTLNKEKTKFMTFSICNNKQPSNLNIKIHTCDGYPSCNCHSLENVHSIKYLGIILDQNLNWKRQIEMTSTRIRKLICIFKKLKHIKDKQTLKIIYFSLCQSIITYGISAWGGAKKTLLIKAERAQRAIIKIINCKPFRYPTKKLFEEFAVLTVRQLFIKSVLLRQHKIKPPPIISKRRIATVYEIPKFRTSFAQTFLNYLGPSLYNKISISLPTLREKTNYVCQKLITEYLLALDYDATENLMRL